MRKKLISLTIFLACGFIIGIYFIGTPVLVVPDVGDLKERLDNQAEVILLPSADEMRFNKRPKEWLRNPFTLLREAGFSGEIAIEAILISQSESRVMIAGETYRENDVVGAYRIKKIFDEYIIITEGAKDLVIKLKKGD
ncbi:MAG: hypothetical protein P9X27_03355 [Candidatus Kaelpia aquatica]|nr:hypothetical protein [Candidatus Kaelpia aquatica]